ncbi:DNA replication complex GINS protein [Lachnellula subtilissima]|uniref:DNA replication complex GINS protein SLD5 n=1 Tax=Lachnellula subtilissima TaxID=602034 RepID=A0A8H8UEE5_9HELO|nr:DNA replication complex GINS protein [Lachnellula subtilissima]
MDISDILQDLNRDRDPFDDDDYNDGQPSGQTDLQDLTRAWINERGAAELLPYPKDNLIERATNRIKAQIEKVEEMTGDMDPKTNFSLIIIQTEVERWKFIIRSILRARIAKIDKHTLYYLSTPELQTRLSETEIAYATRHQQLLHGHYLSSFLGSFPPQLQNLNDTAGGISMIGGPDEDGGVFVRSLGSREIGGDGVVVRGRGRDGDGEVEVARGEVVVARWADVKEAVEKGEMELV